MSATPRSSHEAVPGAECRRQTADPGARLTAASERLGMSFAGRSNDGL